MTIEISAMYEALSDMDDFARMADVDPIGPRKVLETAIAEIEQLRQRVAELEKELEVERMRLAACSTAALGYFNGCCDEYKSASLADVLGLRKSNEKLTSERDALLEANRIACEDLVERHDRIAELKQQRDELVEAATMAVEMIEYNKHERRHVRWKLNDAIASVKEK